MFIFGTNLSVRREVKVTVIAALAIVQQGGTPQPTVIPYQCASSDGEIHHDRLVVGVVGDSGNPRTSDGPTTATLDWFLLFYF